MERGHSCPQQRSMETNAGILPKACLRSGVTADRNVRAPDFGIVLKPHGRAGCGDVKTQARLAALCENGFRQFDGGRYALKAWCLMPNHVHVLVLVTTVPMAEFVKSWKGYTAYRCNEILGRSDSGFWADDYWDTYMRDSEQEW